MKRLLVFSCLLLAGCYAPEACVGGKLYRDASGDGVYTRVEVDLKDGVECVDLTAGTNADSNLTITEGDAK